MMQPSYSAKSNRLSVIFFYNLKRLKSIFVFYSIALFLLSPVALLLELNIWAKERPVDTSIQEEPFLKYPSESIFHLAILVMAIGMPLVLFYYLNQKRALDVFHALPVSRSSLYWGNYLSGLAVMLVPYLICGSISAGIMTAYNQNLDAFYRLLLLALIAVCIFSTMTFVIVNCGTIFESIVHFCLIHLGYLLTVYVGMMYIQQNVLGNAEMDQGMTLVALSPFFQIWYATQKPDIRIVLLPVVSILAAVLGCLLYRARKSESTGQSFAYQPLFYISSFLFSFSMGMGVVLLFKSSIGGVIFGILLGNVCYWILDSIRKRGVRQFLKSVLVGLGATTAVGLFMLTANLTGFFGCEDYIPKAERIESIAVDWYRNTRDNTLGEKLLNRTYPVTDEENIRRVITFHEGVIQNKNILVPSWNRNRADAVDRESYVLTGAYEKYPFDSRYDVSDYDYGMAAVVLNYQLKNGMTVERRYDVPMLLTKPLYDITGSAGYLESYLTTLERDLLDPEKIKNLGYYSDGVLEDYGKPGGSVRYNIADKIAPEFLDAIKKDLQNHPDRFILQSKTNSMERILLGIRDESVTYHAVWELRITPEDQNILALLGKLGRTDLEAAFNEEALLAISEDLGGYSNMWSEEDDNLGIDTKLLPLSDLEAAPSSIKGNMMSYYWSGSFYEGNCEYEIPFKAADEILSLCYTNWLGETEMNAIVLDGKSYVIPPENLEKVKVILAENQREIRP